MRGKKGSLSASWSRPGRTTQTSSIYVLIILKDIKLQRVLSEPFVKRVKRDSYMKEPKFAVIFPFSRDHIERILKGRDVICKYIGERNPRLAPGSRVVFYASGGGYELLGTAVIKDMALLGPDEIVAKYGDRLFISRFELDDYRGGRSFERKLLVMELSKVRKFPRPIKLKTYVTMAGQTLDRTQYAQLVQQVTLPR